MQGSEPTQESLTRELAAVDTARLRLARLIPEHRPLLREMDADPEVMATLGGVRSEVETDRWLAANLEQWTVDGFGIWMAFARDDGHLVGRGGLRTVSLPDGPAVEIAYALCRDAWGQGYATEIARASAAAARRAGLGELFALTLVTNTASENVMQKLGMSFVRTIDWADEPHVLYRLVLATEQAPKGRAQM